MRRVPTSASQFELPFPASKAPKVKPEDVAALVRVLAGRSVWLSAEVLAGLLGDGWNERKVRATARAAAPGIVAFPGSPGYKLIGECTLSEIDRAIRAFRAQADDMTARAVLYHNAYHSGKYGRES